MFKVHVASPPVVVLRAEDHTLERECQPFFALTVNIFYSCSDNVWGVNWRNNPPLRRSYVICCFNGKILLE